MIFKSKRLSEHKEGEKILSDLLEKKDKVLIIHYSCESFITSHGRTPRITSICVRNLGTGQNKTFSIHLQAQFEGIDFNNLNTQDYDQIEKSLLTDYYQFVEKYKDYQWVHWNMRDANYGFEAIANRFRILRGTPVYLADDRLIDLPRVLGMLFTYGFEKNKPKGRLLNLAERNRISTLNALTGKEEADAFDNKEYLKLHISTLRKIDIINAVIERVDKNELKIFTTIKDIYGLSIPGIIEIVRNSWLLLLIWSIFIFTIGVTLEPIIQRFFGTNQ
ncbi:MAG: hypothetical protein MUO72_19075 [Bacteroidales bacterium]|nr:hypothetical protein [Bacteroidales bacterium]